LTGCLENPRLVNETSDNRDRGGAYGLQKAGNVRDKKDRGQVDRKVDWSPDSDDQLGAIHHIIGFLLWGKPGSWLSWPNPVQITKSSHLYAIGSIRPCLRTCRTLNSELDQSHQEYHHISGLLIEPPKFPSLGLLCATFSFGIGTFWHWYFLSSLFPLLLKYTGCIATTGSSPLLPSAHQGVVFGIYCAIITADRLDCARNSAHLP
jgi:hypothetical protein